MAVETPAERLRRLLEQRRQGLGTTGPSPATAYRIMRAGLELPGADPEEPNRILAGLGGAARGLAGFLEPIQLPQDVLFGAVAGALDPNTTIAERMRRVNLRAYLPWGEAPDRPATGKEIFMLAGMPESAAKWAGIGADLFADPLLFGSYLRIGGKLLKADDLITWGDKFDDMLSPMGIGRAVKAGIGKAAPEFSDLIDRRMEQLVTVIRNPESTFLGIENFGAKAQAAFDTVAPRQAQLQLRFGAETGRELRKVERLAEVGGQRVSEQHLNLLAEAHSGLLGERGREFIEGYVGILNRYRPVHEETFEGVSTALRDATERAVYDIGQKRGLLFSEVDEATSIPGATELFNEVSAAAFGHRRTRVSAPDEMAQAVVDGRNKVRAAAKELGENVAQAEARFNEYLQRVTEIDAMLGKHVSGFDFVKGVAYERVQALTGSMDEANEFWRSLMSAGVHGRWSQFLASETKWAPGDIFKTTPERVAVLRTRREAYKAHLFEEMELAGVSDGLIDGEALSRRMATLEEQASRLYRESFDLRQGFRQRGDWDRYETAIDNYIVAVKRNNEAVKDIRKQMGKKGFKEPLVMGRAVKRLQQVTASRLAREAQLEEAMTALVSNERAHGRLQAGLREETMNSLREMETLRREFNQQRFQVHASPEQAAAARARAAEKANKTALPALEKDLSIEELVVERLARGMSFSEALEKKFTVEEIIDSAQAFSHLDLGAYLFGLANGHMRRSYGLFQDRQGFERFISGLRNGKLMMSNILDEMNLPQAMPGFEREAELVTQYLRLVRGGAERGTVINQKALIDHMLENQVEPARAQEAITALVKGMQGSERMRSHIEILEDMVPRYERFHDAHRKGGNRSFYSEREPDIPQPVLELLGEFAMPVVSISESADAARRVMGRQEFFQNVWKLGKAKGLIRDERFVDEFGTRFVRFDDTEGLFKAFSGRYIHPQLKAEMQRVLKKDNTYNGFQRIRALLTGGFLASPNVLAANFFGGLYQSATAGIGPHRMIPRIVKTWDKVRRAQDGEIVEVVERLKKHIPLEISSLAFHDLARAFQGMRLDAAGLGPEGLRKTLGDIEQMYLHFLQRPGVGPLRSRYLGLEGFEMIENVFKIAAFEEMLEHLPKYWKRIGKEFTDDMVEESAAEFARTVVFDYTELPSSLNLLKQTGVLLFPGFTYFLAGRTLETLWKRPGVLGVADRMSEAITNMQLSEDEKLVMWMSMPEWLREEQGVPLAIREGAPGDTRASVIPLAQLIPTSTIWDQPFGQGNPWAESVSSAGLWGPLLEILFAITTGEGEAVLSARFGNRVFDDDAQGLTRTAQIGRFLYNTYAPGVVRKLIRPSFEEGAEGVIPSFAEFVLPPNMTDALYSFEEQRRLRPERTFRDEVLGVMLRSPQVIALDGQIPGVATEIRNSRRELSNELSSLRTKLARAEASGNTRRVQRLTREMEERAGKFESMWDAYLEVYNRSAN